MDHATVQPELMGRRECACIQGGLYARVHIQRYSLSQTK